MSNTDQKAVASKDAARVELLPPSFTMRVGNRRLTMRWRPRKAVPSLLTGLLRRSWRAMFGSSLRISMTAAAICAAWNVPAMAAAPPVNSLPTGGTVTYGNATFTQNGNTLNINQTSGQAIANFTTFSIGANATVDISQPNAAAAFLARVTGSDPSLIYGLLKSNGAVALINQNGIMVGPGGVVDVARFIASTLKISDSDFLAGRLNFNAGAIAGDVDNQGTIKTATGGSVYLIGANVSNSGIIHSPNGEILLAAGQSVQLVDTATPGVSVNVTGNAGNVTNLGTITAEAGRIGIAAGLINNSGNINASSVVSEGGRIFLRASQNLTTTASSRISADGAGKGGSVVLYSDGAANLDGDISAQGAAGQGGYVETSGLKSLEVVKVPTVGSGGTWYIDPYDIEVIASGTESGTNLDNSNPYAVSSSGNSAKIFASTVSGQLNSGVSVVLATGSGGTQAGDIKISSAINKTSGGGASLTLNADNNITINADITSTSGALSLNLNSNYEGSSTASPTHAVNVNAASISLNGGVLNAKEGTGGSNNGSLLINSGSSLSLGDSGTLNAGTLTLANGGTLSSGHISSVNLLGDLNNSGTVTLNDSTLSVGGKLTNQGTVNLANVSGTLGNVTNSATITMVSMFQGISATAFNNSGSLVMSNASTLNAGAMTNSGTATINGSTLNVSTLTNSGTASVVDGTLSATDKVTNAGMFTIGNSTINTLNGFTNSLGATLNLNTYARFDNGGTLRNTGTMNVLGSITTNGDVTNDATGVINLGSDSSFLTISGTGGWTNNGSMLLNGTSRTVQMTNAAGLTNTGSVTLGGSSTWYLTSMSNSGALVLGSGTTLNGTSLSNSGTTTLNGSSMVFNTVANNLGGNISGTGSITASDQFTNDGVLSPGGIGTVGALSINGNFTQSATGVLNLDVASASSYDVLTINAPTTVTLGGTLQSKLLDAYAPPLDTSFSPIVFTGSNNGSTYFRHVLGDVININDSQQMLKVDYKGTIKLVMSASADLTYSGGIESQWGNALNWTGGVLPTAIDNITVAENGVLNHGNSDGTDIVSNITVSSGGRFSMLGGIVAAKNLTSSGDVTVSSGTLALSGAANLSSLYLTSTGTLSGGSSGATLNVTGNFMQPAGTIAWNGGDVVLTQIPNPEAEPTVSGDLTVGNITARNLLLTAQSGSIGQNASTQLHVTQQLTTASASGTTLGNSNNQIAAYLGANSGSGNIVLVNNLATADTSVVRLLGITNANGNVTVDNTGAMATVGPIVVSAGTLSLSTHSPLTIGSGGVNVSGNILLSAGNSNSALDNLVINGVVASSGGNINLFAGNNISVNGNISTSAPGTALFTVINGVIAYAPGVSITDANGVNIPVAAAVQLLVPPAVVQTQVPPVVVQALVSPVVTNVTAPVKTAVVNAINTPPAQVINVVVPPPTLPATNTVAVTPMQAMTTGGEPGTFGGSNTTESTPTTSTGTSKSSTTKVAKMYCN